MGQFIIANIETREVKPWPRLEGEPIEGLVQPPWYELEVVRLPVPPLAVGETAVATETLDFENGQLIHGWQIEQLPPPGADYQSFYDDIIASSVSSVVMSTPGKTGDQAAAMTAFLGALMESKMGRENIPALQAAIWLLLGQITLSAEGVAELQGLMVQHRLADLYTLELPQ